MDKMKIVMMRFIMGELEGEDSVRGSEYVFKMNKWVTCSDASRVTSDVILEVVRKLRRNGQCG